MNIEKQIYAVFLFHLLRDQIVSYTKSLPSWTKKLKIQKVLLQMILHNRFIIFPTLDIILT